ncbi:MAG: hypothetical protein ACRCYV_01145 [Aeromonas sp.]
MSDTNKRRVKLRQDFLILLSNAQLDTTQLSQALEALPSHLFAGHLEESGRGQTKTNAKDWTGSYYQLQLKIAEQNFSRDRVAHLITVRDYFRIRGYQGFVPASVVQPAVAVTHGAQAAVVFTPSENMQKFMAEGDLQTIRTALRMELNNNRIPTEQLQLTFEWANTKYPELCEEYTVNAFAKNIDVSRVNWTTQYYDDQVIYLKSNYAKERYAHLVEVRAVLRMQSIDGFAAVAPRVPSAKNRQQKSHTRHASHHQTAMPMPTIVLVTGALLILTVIVVLAK